MPEGILIELLIALVLVAVVGGVWLLSRRTRRAPEREEPAAPAERPETVTRAPTEEPAETPAAVEVAERPSLRDRLSRSRRFLAGRLSEVLAGGTDDEVWEDLESALIQADVGVEAATTITAEVRAEARERGAKGSEELRNLLADHLLRVFDATADRALAFAPEPPTIWLIVGVNGTGKTTTIGKLARDLTNHQRSVALAAADTFRAAADEQLAVWADRAGAELVRHQPGADPGAVAFDAFQFSRARGIDVLIVDTAGRLHTKTPLMDELAKVRRVLEKESRVHEALLVIDATAGQNGLVQARRFAEAAGVSGIVLTKLDGTAKGGIAVAIEDSLGLPIKLIGIGESLDDLEPFDPKTFVDALLR